MDARQDHRFPEFTYNDETWGTSCICNDTSFCNRDLKANETSQTNKTCYVCDDKKGCLTPNVTACPMGYCETQLNFYTGMAEYRGCVKTELWGLCALEVVNGTGGCYDNRTIVSELCWQKYGFDPYYDIKKKGRLPYWNVKTCVCNQTLWNNEGLTPPTTESSRPNPIKNPQANHSTRNTNSFLQNIGLIMNFCFFLDKYVAKHF